MPRSVRAAFVLCGLFAAAVAAGQEGNGPRITQLRVDARGRDVFLGFTLAGALNPELARKIEAGLETAIRYEIRLYRRYPYWFDDLVEKRKYRAAATNAPVTRQYAVEEMVDGKPLRRTTTRDFAEAKPLRPDAGDLRCRVRFHHHPGRLAERLEEVEAVQCEG